MPLTLRVSFYCLALSLGFSGAVSSHAQSSSSVPDAVQSSNESALHAVTQQYFVFYASKNLGQFMNLWSEKSPDYASLKQALQRQFTTEDNSFGVPAITRLRLEEGRADLQATVNLTATDLKSNQKRTQQIVRNFAFVMEEGKWKVWRSVPAQNDLAEALVKAQTDSERSGLLADQKDLVTPELVIALNKQGDLFGDQRNYPQALAIYRLAQTVAEQVGDKAGIGDTLNKIGDVLDSQGDYSEALAHYQKGLALMEAIGDKGRTAISLGNIGTVHWSQGNYAEAVAYYQRSLALLEALGDKARISSVLSNMGLVHSSQGDYEQALESYRKSLAIDETLKDEAGIASTLSNMGLVHHSQGNYAQALELFQKSLTMNEALENKLGIARVLNNIGRVHRIQGNYPQALEYYRKSLAISEVIGSKYGIALVLNNVGLVHRLQGNYALALEALQKSLAMRETLGDKSGTASTLSSLGRVRYSQGDYAQALEYLQKSLAIREAIGEKAGIADTLNSIGDVCGRQGQYLQARDFAERAATLARQIGDTEILWKARLAAGAASYALKEFAQARLAFEEAIAIIEKLRTQVAGGSGEQQLFFESKVFAYHAMVDLLAREHKPFEAFIFAERAKARVLLDVLQTGRVNVTKAMTSSEQEEERRMNSQLVSLNTQISRETTRAQPDQARLTELNTQLQKARLGFEDFQTILYGVHPELRIRRGEIQPLTLEQAAALLPDAATALLEYVVTDDRTYLFAITKSTDKLTGKSHADVRLYTLPIKRDELARRTEVFRQQLAGRDLGFRASAHQLYDLLLKPAQALLRGKTNLIIVPDDKLWELPFQALLTDDDRYVIEESAVSYGPSMSVLREMSARRNKRLTSTTGNSLLALGNPAIGKETIDRATLALRNESFTPLPEAEQEVRALGALYGLPRSKIYIGPEASEDRVKAEAGQAGILHFATHGTLNNVSPMYSRLLLAQGGSNEDGLLEAWELMKMDLKADLAVLSACETARGKYGAGEGMIGLTWAMFVAGVPSTVVSQWKVESASTRDLMLSFHRLLNASSARAKTNVTKAEALQQAALRVLKNPETTHPFYWAGFVLIGDGR